MTNANPPPPSPSSPPPAPPPAPPSAVTRLRPDHALTRRQLLRTTAFGSVGMLLASALVGSGIMFWPASVRGFGGKVLVPIPLGELDPTAPPLKVREGKFYLSRLPDGIIALYWKCTHLGCTVPWSAAEGRFHCPCHGSIYTSTGENIGGPAPRPLDMMAITVQGQEIWVDTGQITQRSLHLPEHVTRV